MLFLWRTSEDDPRRKEKKKFDIVGEERQESADKTEEMSDPAEYADILALANDACDYIESDEFNPDDMELIRFRKHMEDYRDRRLNNLNL